MFGGLSDTFWQTAYPVLAPLTHVIKDAIASMADPPIFTGSCRMPPALEAISLRQHPIPIKSVICLTYTYN
jgi:hypothetical protein